MLCYSHLGHSDRVVSAGLVARRACVIPGCQYLSPQGCGHCWAFWEPLLHVEEPGRGLCVLSVCLQAHASLKEQGFGVRGDFSQHLRCMWNRSKLLEAGPDVLWSFSSCIHCFLLMCQPFLLSSMVTWNLVVLVMI